MSTSYQEAVNIIQQHAIHAASQSRAHNVPAQDSVGRIAASTYLSPQATPIHTTSAMDGFLVESAATAKAEPNSPVRFIVVGTIVPGQQPSNYAKAAWANGGNCLEIMTGGQFPDANFLDACVPVEHVAISVEESKTGTLIKSIAVTTPVRPGANRRLSGSDIAVGQTLVQAGQQICTSHLLPLLSANIETVSVVSKPRIGIWSTGNEFVSVTSNATMDINGPYLTAICREFGANPEFLGYLDDNQQSICDAFETAVEFGLYDILITTGAVSAGKFDLIRPALISRGADIVFHGVSMRPGHPALFASMSHTDTSRQTAFFGLPGNPGAAAACFRFLVVPFLRGLLRKAPEQPTLAKAMPLAPCSLPKTEESANTIQSTLFRAHRKNDSFVPARLKYEDDVRSVQLLRKPCPAQLAPFISANCWVYIPRGCDVLNGDLVEYYPLSAGTTDEI